MTVEGLARTLHAELSRGRFDQPKYDDLPDSRREMYRRAAGVVREALTGEPPPAPPKSMNEKLRERRASA